MQTGVEKISKIIAGCYDEQRLQHKLKNARIGDLREWLQWKTPLSYATAKKELCILGVINTHLHNVSSN
jgi:hypothetical protein